MKRQVYFVIPIAILFALQGVAQDKGGNVAIHTDPRLALLLNRTKVEKPEPALADNIKPELKKKSKEKIIPQEGRVSNKKGASTEVTYTATKEPKYLYTPGEEDAALVEKTAKNKAGNKPPAISKEDLEERMAYKKAREVERENAAKNRSSEEEIKEYKEAIENDRKNTTTSKKVGKTGIAADEVRYLTSTVSGTSRGGKYNGTGYRVQIYYGTSRDEAMRRKAEFMRHYPGVPTYFSYTTPTYRVKVGDYRRRDDAISMFREANGTYSPCMIVPDVVSIR